MGEITRSQLAEINLRRSQQDLNDLLNVINEDDGLKVVDDPTEKEIEAAAKKEADEAEKAQAKAEKEAAAAAKKGNGAPADDED